MGRVGEVVKGEGEGSEVVWVGWLMQKGSKASFYRL